MRCNIAWFALMSNNNRRWKGSIWCDHHIIDISISTIYIIYPDIVLNMFLANTVKNIVLNENSKKKNKIDEILSCNYCDSFFTNQIDRFSINGLWITMRGKCNEIWTCKIPSNVPNNFPQFMKYFTCHNIQTTYKPQFYVTNIWFKIFPVYRYKFVDIYKVKALNHNKCT